MNPSRLAVAAAALCLVALPFAYGVSVGDALLHLGYLLAFVVAPGCLVLVALSGSRPDPMRLLAFGPAVGYVLSILAFVLTAALDVRDAYLAYPVIACAGAYALARRRDPEVTPDRTGAGPSSAWAGWTALVSIAAMACFAVAYFPQTPIPGSQGAGYFPDYTWHVALAADALHQWPILDPHAAGSPQPYHYFTNLQLSATSQVSGLDLPVLLFRLAPLAMVGLLVVQIAVAGRELLRNRWAGLVAAALALLVADLQIDPAAAPFGQIPFLGLGFALLFGSPSFLLGMLLFVPLLTLIGERLAGRPGWIGDWALIAILAVGAAFTKVTILPILLVALLLFSVWQRYVRGAWPRAVLTAGGIALAVVGASWVLLYSGHSGGLEVDPLRTFDQMPALFAIKVFLDDAIPGPLLDGVGALVGLVGLLGAQLAGLAWLGARGVAPDAERAWLAALVVAGLAVLLLMSAPGTTNQLYFVFLGVVAGCLLSGEGLTRAWAARPAIRRDAALRAALLVAGWIGVLAALMVVPFELADERGLALLLAYGGLAASVVVLYAVARAWLGPGRWPARALATAAVIAAGALAIPLAFLVPEVRGDRPEVAPTVPLTPAFHDAMLWIRDEVPFDETIAVNYSSALQFHPSAFSEHRVYIEGWQYSQASVDAGFDDVAAGRVNPFADRVAINEAAFGEADREALRTMYEDHGVRYLVVDEENGMPVDDAGLERFTESVYEAPGVRVLALEAPA